MEKVSLVKIAKINMGQSPLSESYNKIGDGLPFFQGKTDFGDVYPKVRIFCTSPNKIAEANDILLSVRAPVGSINICKTKSCIGRGLAAIRAKAEIEQKYLYHFLNYYEPQLAQIGKGSTFEAVNREDVENIEVPLPKPDEQKRIAAILDKADHLRRQRRFAQTLSNSFLQSVFIKMFGDPVSNPMNWKTNNIGRYTNLVSSGSTPLGGEMVYKKSGVRFIRSQNVLMSDFDFSDIAFIDEETHKSMKRTHIKKNDVLINITGASIGRVACYKEETIANVNQHVCIIRLKDKDILPDFLARQLSMPFYQTTVISSQSGATRQAFNFEQIKDFQIIAPPLPLQEKFAEIAQKFERVRRQQREATRQAEHLFQTLLHRAFRGEL